MENNTLPARVVITKQYLIDIADAIRAATGTSDPLTIDQMIAMIGLL